jgi:hypothetical protein
MVSGLWCQLDDQMGAPALAAIWQIATCQFPNILRISGAAEFAEFRGQYIRLLRARWVAVPVPFCRAEHRRDFREPPEGVREGSRASVVGAGAPSADPRESREAQEFSRQRGRLSLVPFFGEAKKGTRRATAMVVGGTAFRAWRNHNQHCVFPIGSDVLGVGIGE